MFDHNVPRRLRTFLRQHYVATCREMGWHTLTNGRLLAAAEAHDFDVMITGDKNISHQQNLLGKKLSLVVLANTDWRLLQLNTQPLLKALDGVKPGSFTHL